MLFYICLISSSKGKMQETRGNLASIILQIDWFFLGFPDQFEEFPDICLLLLAICLLWNPHYPKPIQSSCACLDF